MRITSIDLSLGADMDLKPGVMRPLGELVVLAGANGAGKSRILHLVHRQVGRGLKIPGLLKDLERLQREPEKNAKRLAKVRADLEREGKVKFQGEPRTGKAQFFFPRTPDLDDHRALAVARVAHHARELADGVGIGALRSGALAYIATLAKRWISATHPRLVANGAERESAAAEWTRLEALVRDLLGASLTVDLNQEPNLFGRPIPECKLSEGQCMLLQTAVLLHAQSTKLEDLVLLVDEPECHLHPSAVVDAVQRIRDASRLGQIWIATHSVPLLATVPPESIWFVHDGEASWAGRRTESVLDGLLGGSEGREQIAEFLRLPAQLASIRFAAQCLIPPGTVNTGPDDPQAAQLRDYCQSRAPVGDGVLRVLDYGAGKGRLLSAMVERWTDARPFADAVDYRAFEPRAATELDDLVGSIFGENGMQRVFRSQVELSMLDQHSFDVVVMCNVLHEVPPEQWKHLFGSAGCMTRLLKPSGAVLILEDMQLPHGERAHRHGFLLLDTPQLHILTACTEADGARIQTRDVNDGRLKAHAVPAQLLGRTTTETAKAALACLQEQAREEVLSLRDKDPDSRNGHMHALWTQLLANADLGQRSL